MTAFDLGFEVLEQPDARTVGVVAGELEEVELVLDGEGAREVGHEDEARERGDEQQVPALVLAGELGAELADARVQLLACGRRRRRAGRLACEIESVSLGQARDVALVERATLTSG